MGRAHALSKPNGCKPRPRERSCCMVILGHFCHWSILSELSPCLGTSYSVAHPSRFLSPGLPFHFSFQSHLASTYSTPPLLPKPVVTPMLLIRGPAWSPTSLGCMKTSPSWLCLSLAFKPRDLLLYLPVTPRLLYCFILLHSILDEEFP